MKDNIFKRFGSFLGKNKKLSILVGVGILVVCAIVATLIFVLNNDTPTPEPTPPAPVGGAEVGEYYYDVAGGEVLLTLQSDMKFTLEGPDVNKSGSYTVSGNDITLDFVRDEDGTATAKLDGDKLTVTMDGATLTFLKKVKFTLTNQNRLNIYNEHKRNYG